VTNPSSRGNGVSNISQALVCPSHYNLAASSVSSNIPLIFTFFIQRYWGLLDLKYKYWSGPNEA